MEKVWDNGLRGVKGFERTAFWIVFEGYMNKRYIWN